MKGKTHKIEGYKKENGQKIQPYFRTKPKPKKSLLQVLKKEVIKW